LDLPRRLPVPWQQFVDPVDRVIADALDDVGEPGLLLPILIYCVDKKGLPVLGKPRPGPETAHFIENEAYLDISAVVPAIKEIHDPIRYPTQHTHAE